jgi:two-component SAPR family response regulator
LKKIFSYYTLLTLCALFTFFNSKAQTYNSLSQSQKQVFRLKSQLLIKTQNQNVSSIKQLLDSKLPIAIEYSHESDFHFIESILKLRDSITIITNKNIDAFLAKYPSILQVKKTQIESIDLRKLNANDSTIIRFTELKELGRINFIGNTTVSDSLVNSIWNNSGKLPHFIDTDSSSITKALRIVNLFNASKKVFGVVKTENGLLKNVSFKNFIHRKANGYFSFQSPTTGRRPILIPYKAGYYFSPDIIFTNTENGGNQKEFTGFPLDPNFGLTDYFTFDKTATNSIRKNSKDIISKQVKTSQNQTIGGIGFFENRAYIDAGIESRTALKSSFTITAWIKPTKLGFANSILGKGANFVLKVHQGFLTFTMAGVKDYISKSSPIPLDKWTHISLVYSEIDNQLSFYIDGKHTDTVQLISNYITSEHNLLIGNNLWEEFFIGYLGSIKIWERELNDTEIKYQYSQPKKSNYTAILVTGILLLVSFATFFLYRQKAKKKKHSSKTTTSKKVLLKKQDITLNNYKEHLLCFGPLQITNANGVDIATKLSPKLKQLFLLIFLHSTNEKKGISTKKLTEILWPGMDTQSAKNTRGTNVQNLRAVLSSCSEIKLLFLNKHWFLEINEACFSDYTTVNNYLQLFVEENYSVTLLENKLSAFLSLLKRGRLFSNSSAAWLDPHIEKISHQIIKECFHYIDALSIEKHAELLLESIEIIHIYDDLNEKALRLKLQILIHQGRLSLAHTFYGNFVKLYQKIYKEPYSVSFEKTIS